MIKYCSYEGSGDTFIGEACRRTPGTGPGSCYLWAEAAGESRETAGNLKPLVDRTIGCPFQQKVLQRIKEAAQSGRDSRGFLGIIKDVLMMPSTMRGLMVEMHELNNNLQRLTPILQKIPELTEVMGDLRTMAAPWLGFNVVEKEKE